MGIKRHTLLNIILLSVFFVNCGNYLLKKPASFDNKKITVNIHYMERSIKRVMSGGRGDYQAADGSDFIKVFATFKNISLFDVDLKADLITMGNEKMKIPPALVFPFKSKDKLDSIVLPQRTQKTVLLYFEVPADYSPEYFFVEDVGNIKLHQP